jgi:hypothetical protein
MLQICHVAADSGVVKTRIRTHIHLKLLSAIRSSAGGTRGVPRGTILLQCRKRVGAPLWPFWRKATNFLRIASGGEASMAWNAKTAAIVLGLVFLLVGVLGFIPNPLVSRTGLFVVNTPHNLVHIVSGLVLLAGAYTTLGARMSLQIIGWVYVVVAIIGFFSSDLLLGIIQQNTADRWLHVVLAIVVLGAAYTAPDEQAAIA